MPARLVPALLGVALAAAVCDAVFGGLAQLWPPLVWSVAASGALAAEIAARSTGLVQRLALLDAGVGLLAALQGLTHGLAAAVASGGMMLYALIHVLRAVAAGDEEA